MQSVFHIIYVKICPDEYSAGRSNSFQMRFANPSPCPQMGRLHRTSLSGLSTDSLSEASGKETQLSRIPCCTKALTKSQQKENDRIA
jgi:hypothetical protein